MCKVLRKNIFIALSTLLLLFAGRCLAGTEHYESTLLGPFNTLPATCMVQDSLFTNPAWASITNKTVQNTVALRIMDNVLISAPFTYTVNLQIQYYTSPTSPLSPPVNISLTVNYAAGQGVKYKGMDTYSFTGGFKVLVTVTSTSFNGGTAPPANAVQLLNTVIIDRTYPFVGSAGILPNYAIANNSTQLTVSWPALNSADAYDVEWTTINNGNANYSVITTNINTPSSPDNATVSTALGQAFRNNASRLTTKSNSCTLSILSTDNIFLVRIRQAQYTSDGIRMTGNWDYTKGTKYAIWVLDWTEPDQNWQYSAAFAEDGKKKEVISYFDGTLRGRQTVTLNNSDNVAIAQENVYDEFGRPSASILPAPYKEPSLIPYLHYIPKLNINASGTPYNYANIIGTGTVTCEFNPDPLNTASGASKYYSTKNDFKTLNAGNTYIPDAAGFPLSVTQYTADNTGRIKLQSGVGVAFQPGKSTSSNTTKYYYGKPEQWELDQLFANDAGFAEHYLKNMVVDPNGQISISYLNASGKTVATALTGPAPKTLDSLQSYHSAPPGTKPQNLHILKPGQFIYDNTALTLTANTTYLASVTGTDTLKFSMQKLVNNYPGPEKFDICSNCYYKMTATVTDDCGNIVAPIVSSVEIGSKVANCGDTLLYQNPILVHVNHVGEYNVSIQLAFDKDAIQTYTDAFIKKGIDNAYIEKQFDYIKERYLDGLKTTVTSCYSDCHTCSAMLGGQTDFVQMLKDKCLALGLDPAGIAGATFDSWATDLYTTLKTQCDALQASCKYSPCSAMENAMLDDVSPGGQYALFDAAGNALEPGANVLTDKKDGTTYNWRVVFPKLSPSDPTYQANLIVKPDNTTTSPNDDSFTQQDLITYWQPAWAISFLQYHPENCKLKYCHDNELYESWDQVVQQDFNKTANQPFTLPNDGGTLSYSHTNPLNFLLSADPFFKDTGPGHDYFSQMSDELANYSNKVLNKPISSDNPVKSLMQFVDYLLYCQDAGASTNTSGGNPNWTCTPDDGCRVADREWAAYRQYYFELKEKYYTILRNAACGSSFCPIGQPISSGVPGTCSKNTTDYAIQPAAGVSVCSGSQTAAVVYLPGTITSTVTVYLYYPDAYSARTDVVRSVIINPGVAQQTFCVPTDIPIGAIKVSSVYCGDAPFGNDPSYKVKVTDVEAGTVDHYCGIDPSTFHVFTTTIQLLNSSGVPVFATSQVTVKLNYDVVTVFGSPSVSYSPDLIIPVGQNTATNVYVHSRGPGGCDWSYSQRLNCISSINGVSYLESTTLPCTGYTATNPQPPSSSCPSVYATKTPRFPEYSNFPAGEVPGILAGSDLTVPVNAQIATQAADICTANADVWISKLQPGFDAARTPADDISTLKTELIKICSAGGDQTHPMGASTTPPGPYTYTSFGAAIKSIILSGGSFTPTINPWLIDAPYPYDGPPQQSVEKIIGNSNTALCTLLGNYETLATAAGQTTYDYLLSTYGSAMTLSAADLTVLHKSCNTCMFILANDITLPVFLDPGSQGCITRSAYISAKADVISQFASLTPADANYETIISNYLNQKWGFSLTYDDYAKFEAGSASSLCNTIPYTSVNADPYDCVKNAVSIAVSSGKADYDAYIAQHRQNFIADYVNTCKLAKANANMIAVQQEYHYTLYYYDQADNLVRTVPPEGVTLLNPGTFNFIDKARELDTAAYTYTYNGPTSPSSLSAAMGDLSTTLSVANGAVEMWLYNAGLNHYHWVEATTDKKYIFQVGIANSQLNIDVYPLTQANAGNTVATTITGHYYADISSLLPLLPFTHVVFQGAALGLGTNLPQLYLNGHALTVTKNSAVPPPFGFTVAAGTGSITYPDSIQSLKHLRLYNKLLSPATIAAQAADIFFNATDLGYIHWYRFNVPVAGAPPTTINGTINEIAIYDTYPAHRLLTSYVYNSTNQVNTQRSPDGGTNKFWYDLLSRLVISQNEKQLAANNYSYTTYDLLGRITEVGQKNQTTVSLGTPDYLGDDAILSFGTTGSNSQITHTYYDKPVPTVSGNTDGIATLPGGQSFLRKRVAASTYTETQGSPALRATYYNYDLDGNVKTLWQQIDGLYQNSTNSGLKQIDYEFDLVSGKVNNVRYQDGKADAFYYNYRYDAENRLTEAWSSTNALVDTLTGTYLPRPFRKRDAKYEYYLHGPLRRMVLGNDSVGVNGIDYAYTLQGWLKGVNSSFATAAADIGQDGADLTHKVARDAYGYSLGYYTGDYNPIGGSVFNAFNLKYVPDTLDITGQSLYNGNISNTTLAIAQLDGTNVNGYTYHYDQLNRLKKMRRHPNINCASCTTWSRSSIRRDYQENVTYDGNGNILTYGRNGAVLTTAQTIDSLTYNYNRNSSGRLINNKLKNINDAVAASSYLLDLTNQTNATNYRYDAIGNLIYDDQSGITGNDGVNSITWSVYGKIQSIYKNTGTISYTYNPAGQRVSKTAGGLTTWYVHDAQGNTLATYDNAHSTINWKEQQLYGSSRLGLWAPNADLTAGALVQIWDTVGHKQYELNNHLGNVLATITEKRLQHATSGALDYYMADVATAQEYYPFGMLMPGRQSATGNYRYGFNGKENDNEVKGVGNEQDYGVRIYDPRVGRFLSVDPLSPKYPELTPYQFASNRPIDGIDLDGKEWEHIWAPSDYTKLRTISAKDGFGPLVKATYNLQVHGNYASFEGLKDVYSRDPGMVHNPDNEHAFYTPIIKGKTIAEGDFMKIRVAATFGIIQENIYVRFTKVNITKNSFNITAATLQGHTDAGFINFSGTFDPETNTIDFAIHNETTNNVGIDLVKYGRSLQTKQWKLILNNVEKYLAGKTISKTMDKQTESQDAKKGDKVTVEHQDLVTGKDSETQTVKPW